MLSYVPHKNCYFSYNNIRLLAGMRAAKYKWISARLGVIVSKEGNMQSLLK